jgi:S-(hydroxymethyl)glutathione dehydrogenase/alcohol dehydrogenase
VRAAVYVPGADDLVVETLTPLTPSDRDVVVRVAASGVCHSDQAVIDGKRLGPIILGHEATGVVEWTGPDVTRVQPGDRVIMSLTPVCGRCWYCVRNETHLCERNAVMLPRLRATRADGSQANALAGIGSFADVITVDEASCIQVHTDLPAEQLSLIGCGFTTGFGAAVNTAAVPPGARWSSTPAPPSAARSPPQFGTTTPRTTSPSRIAANASFTCSSGYCRVTIDATSRRPDSMSSMNRGKSRVTRAEP